MAIFLIFLVSLPALAAIGHDIWLYYNDPSRPFEFAALGFIWTKYHPESYRAVMEGTSPETWGTINYLLTFPALYLGLVFALFFYAVIGLCVLFKPSGEKKEKSSARNAAKSWKPKTFPKKKFKKKS